MKQIKKLLAGAALASLTAFNAHATVHNIPDGGTTELFFWADYSALSDDSFAISVAGPSFITVTLTDGYAPGDEFSLKLDGHDVAWTSTGLSGGYFQGKADNVLLSSGSHLFEIYLTAFTPGFGDGAAYASFSAVTAVPEPATYGMLLGGLGLLGLAGRRKRA